MFAGVCEQITRAILAAFPGLSTGDLVCELPPKREMGDVGVPCFKLAKKLGLNPAQASQRIADAVSMPRLVGSVRPVGPYANFFFDRKLYAKELLTEVRAHRDFGSSHSGAGMRVLIEHTSINPNASPHLGRTRNAMIGDCLTRLLRFEGYETEAHYYVNDMGKQIALLVLECRGKEDLQFDDILDYYVSANKKAKEDPAFEEAGFELLRKLEEGDPETAAEFRKLTDISLKGQVDILRRLGIVHDCYDRESDYAHDPRVERVLEKLKDLGALFVDELGRSVVDLKKLSFSKEEGQYFVLRRANGSSMYGYRDIAYTLDKIARKPDVNLIVLGEDHKLYFEQLGTILKAAGESPPEPVHYSYIILKEGKMSTRQGSVVLLSDFLDEAISRAREKVDASCKSLPDEERESIASKIGIGAVKFDILRVTPSSNITFDWETALTFEGSSGPYIQYSCARISSILRKYGKDAGDAPEQFPALSNAEWELLLRISMAPDRVSAALRDRNSGILTEYSIDLAQRFTEFYHKCPVLQAKTEDTVTARLNICLATRQVLQTALSLLGIDAPERM